MMRGKGKVGKASSKEKQIGRNSFSLSTRKTRDDSLRHLLSFYLVYLYESLILSLHAAHTEIHVQGFYLLDP